MLCVSASRWDRSIIIVEDDDDDNDDVEARLYIMYRYTGICSSTLDAHTYGCTNVAEYDDGTEEKKVKHNYNHNEIPSVENMQHVRHRGDSAEANVST